MLFFKFETKLVKKEETTTREQRNVSELYEAYKSFVSQNPGCYLGLVDLANDYCKGYGIFSEYESLEEKVRKFLEISNLKEDGQIDISEVTTIEMTNLSRSSYRKGYSDDPREIYYKLRILELYDDHGYEEYVIEDNYSKEDLIEEAKGLLYTKTLVNEIERIYSCKETSVIGNPVHYLILEDNQVVRKKVALILAKALMANNRVKGKRLTYDPYLSSRRNVPSDMGFSGDIYRANKDGLVNIDFYNDDDLSEGEFTMAKSNIKHIIRGLCDNMKKFKNNVLTIFSTIESDAKFGKEFYENLSNCRIVEIKHDVATKEESINYLSLLAKKQNIELDEDIKNRLDNLTNYNSNELDKLFDDWFNKKLSEEIYPEYNEVSPVVVEEVATHHEGSGYELLQNLTGLKNAKEVIDSAINYYKAQKLFADKGMKKSRVSMHMCFSGNPGTAKTTVARLFADIMRENGILSKGELIEVGRADLVGQYVGQTAPLVKRAFKRARGNVLFIDEAYSLVDDRDGLYGDEAINTIVQEMENNRDDTIVIFAGYPDKMAQFIDKNPGLKSRIAFNVQFDDYSPDELCEIAEFVACQNDLTISDEAMAKLKEIFEVAVKNKDFGNGRFVRNAIEKAQMKQASRLVSMDYNIVREQDLSTLCKCDFEGFGYEKSQAKKCIGF